MKYYWFKPKKLGIIAAYYPVTIEGWIVTILCAAAFIYFFIDADLSSHSVSDTLYSFFPNAIMIMIVFDLISFRTGEYPSWWKRRWWHKH